MIVRNLFRKKDNMKIAAVLFCVCLCVCYAKAQKETNMGDCSGAEKTRQTFIVPGFPDRVQYRFAQYSTEVSNGFLRHWALLIPEESK